MGPDSEVGVLRGLWLYFPGEGRNRRDFLYRPDLLMEMKEAEGARQGRFHFMLGEA
jgi:hypothetical protein